MREIVDNYLPDESIYLFLQVIVDCLELVFNRSRSNRALWIGVEEDWWVCYNMRAGTFLEYKFSSYIEFDVFSFTADDTPDIVHHNMAKLVENVLCSIECPSVQSKICLHG